MRSKQSFPERILEVAQQLTKDGMTQFTPSDIQKALPDITSASINSTMRSMTKNIPGVAFPIAQKYWKNCFERVDRGKYVLLNKEEK